MFINSCFLAVECRLKYLADFQRVFEHKINIIKKLKCQHNDNQLVDDKEFNPFREVNVNAQDRPIRKDNVKLAKLAKIVMNKYDLETAFLSLMRE
jgi:hypothetical protein